MYSDCHSRLFLYSQANKLCPAARTSSAPESDIALRADRFSAQALFLSSHSIFTTLLVMGPGLSSSDKFGALPSRPNFSWDTKNVPWTYVPRPQDGFAKAVELWCDFHGMLDDGNSNKIPRRVRGIILRSQLNGRARYLPRNLDKDVLKSEEGANKVVSAIYQREPLSVVSEVHADFTAVIHFAPCRERDFQVV